MTTSGLASPPRASRPRIRPSAPPPPEPNRRSRRDRPSYERVLAWSIGISLVAHFLFLTLSSIGIQVDLPAGGPVRAASPAASQPFGMQMVIVIPSENAPENPPLPDRTPVVPTPRTSSPTPTQPSQAARPGQAVSTDAPPATDDSSVGDAFRPGYEDPRLYRPENPFPEPRQTQHEAYMEHLEARLNAVNDSLGIAAERESRTSGWTTDDGRWGIDDEGLHLGGFTVPRELLPLPRATGDNATLQEDRERQRMRDEIQEQEADRERDETRDERLDAIQDRADQERQDAQE